jgi:hypothetical protein
MILFTVSLVTLLLVVLASHGVSLLRRVWRRATKEGRAPHEHTPAIRWRGWPAAVSMRLGYTLLIMAMAPTLLRTVGLWPFSFRLTFVAMALTPTALCLLMVPVSPSLADAAMLRAWVIGLLVFAAAAAFICLSPAVHRLRHPLPPMCEETGATSGALPRHTHTVPITLHRTHALVSHGTHTPCRSLSTPTAHSARTLHAIRALVSLCRRLTQRTHSPLLHSCTRLTAACALSVWYRFTHFCELVDTGRSYWHRSRSPRLTPPPPSHGTHALFARTQVHCAWWTLLTDGAVLRVRAGHSMHSSH